MDRLEVKAALAVDDKGTVTGIAWPFGEGPDQYGDTIRKGAFKIAVEAVPMLFGHNPEDLIGLWEDVRETDRGLEVRGQLSIKQSDRARCVRSMITSGLLGGLSIGFRTKASSGQPGKDRIISALDLVEVSIVRNPAHPRARIMSVKSASAAIALAEAINRAATALRTERQ